ncbi:LOW QUALITY PROTEIN: uncharacterized protein LOC144103421 [Amblyomma americanum]
MEDGTPQLGAEYSSTQALVQLIDIADGATTASQLRQQRTSQRRRSMALGMMKILLLLSLIVAGPVITFLLLRPCEKRYDALRFISNKVSPYGEKNAYFGLPEVVNLRLVSAADDSFTVAWERPDGDFDHYWIGVAGDSGRLDANETHRVGSCARGTILHADQTRVTCSHIETCTMVNFTVRTYKNGPPQIASSGATLQSILIPGKGPYPPKNINLLRISSTQTRLQWEPAAEVHGSLASYAVKVCGEFSPCDVAQDLSNCTDYETTGTSLVVDSISNSSYCIAVTTVEVCGERVTASPPAAAELKAPFTGLPEVVNLRLVSAADDSFTVAWERPDGDFDHYWIGVAGDSGEILDGNETHRVGSCARGTILHADQTRVTCSHIETCTMVNFTVRTYKNGPPQIASSGATLQGILIPGPGPQPPYDIKIHRISPTQTRLQWKPPAKVSGRLGSYAVKICDMFASCDAEQYVSGCTSYETIEPSLEVDSMTNASYCAVATTVEVCGGRVTASLPAVAELKAPFAAPPDVSDLRLEGVGDDYFTASWQRPRGTFDYYSVDVTDNTQEENGIGHHHLGSCANGTILHPDQTKVSCNKLDSCANVTFRVRTHRNGPPEQTSPGATLRNIFIPGGAPGDFDVDATAASATTVQISLHLSQVKQCLKAKCYGLILGGSSPIPFPCHDYVGTEKTLTVRNVVRRRTYFLHVVLVNSHNERNTTKGVVFHDERPACDAVPPVFSGCKVDQCVAHIGRQKRPEIGMEDDTPQLGAQYSSTQALVQLMPIAHGAATASQLREQRTSQRRRSMALGMMKILLLLSLIFAGPVITFLLLRPCEKVSANGEKNAYFGLPEGVNLRLVSAADDFFTVTWERPDGDFDHYWIGVAGDSGESLDADETHCVGSCARGTILHPDQTRVTCSHIETCTMVNFTVRTYKNGPPQIASSGATLQSILIPGKGSFSYLTPIDHNCTDYETTGSSIVVDSIYNSSYSIVVTTFQVFGERLTASLPATAELKAPLRGHYLRGCTPTKPPTLHGPLGAPHRYEHGHENALLLAAVRQLIYLNRAHGEVSRRTQLISKNAYFTLLNAVLPILGRNIMLVDDRLKRWAYNKLTHLSTGLPEVANLRLVSAADDSFTVTWERPDGDFDRSVRCSRIETCTTANLTVRTYKNGPPQLRSSGATLQGISISGQGSFFRATCSWLLYSSTSRKYEHIQDIASTGSTSMETTGKDLRRLGSYAVKICYRFVSCDAEKFVIGCRSYETTEPWLEFDSMTNASYCATATTVEVCGGCVAASLPAVVEFKAPLTAPPQVSGQRLEEVGDDYFTASMQLPKGTFDYYWVDVTVNTQDGNGVRHQPLGSCANGTILHPDQTKVSCNKLDACANFTFMVRTHRNGPPEQSSPGAIYPWWYLHYWRRQRRLLEATLTRRSKELRRSSVRVLYPEPPQLCYIGALHLQLQKPAQLLTVESPRLMKMGEEKPPVSLQYSPADGSVVMLENFEGASKAPETRRRKIHKHRKSFRICIKFILPLCLIIAGPSLTFFFLRYTDKESIPGNRVAHSLMPDVLNLTLQSTNAHSFTVAWERPEGHFDYYRIEISKDSSNKTSPTELTHVGTCPSGTIIHPDQTHVTCAQLEACNSVSFTVRTSSNIPMEVTSVGVTLHDIFVPGPEPDPPKMITISAISRFKSRLQWDTPSKASVTLSLYTVEVCDALAACEAERNVSGCTKNQTSEKWLEFATNTDTSYCVLVSSSALCGTQVVTSRPAVAVVRTPSFVLPEVGNLSVTSAANNTFSFTWQKPKGPFDYYNIEVTQESDDEHGGSQPLQMGSCAVGTTIHPDQTRITCSHLEACKKTNVTVRSFGKEPTELTSNGVSLENIFIPGSDPDPPMSIVMKGIDPYRSSLAWQPPAKISGSLTQYIVVICHGALACDAGHSLHGCSQHSTSETWLEFESTENTMYCAMVTATAQCGEMHLKSHPSVMKFTTPLFALPDVANLSVASAADNNFTVTWQRPQVRFDYYKIKITQENEDTRLNASSPYVGACSEGTIIHYQQAQVTCSHLEACKKTNFTVRTFSNGPPEHISYGVTVESISIPGQDPDPPRNVIMTPSRSRRQWEPPAKIYGTLKEYKVKVCDTYKSCDGEHAMNGCAEYETLEAQLEFDSTAGTQYCVAITAAMECGAVNISSRPVVAPFKTPLLVLPDVASLSLVAAGSDFFTVKWERPEVPFDYYMIEAAQPNENSSERAEARRAGSCSSGTIIHPNQTQVTCSSLKPCTKWTFTVHTYSIGPPALTSLGASLYDISVLDQAPDPPTSISMVAVSPSLRKLEWGLPRKASERTFTYTVNICANFTTCDAKEVLGECAKYETLERWVDFNSTGETSYCVQIRASELCGEEILQSQPATAEIRTPLFEPPDAANLRLESVAPGSFTVAWEEPQGVFEYYLVETFLEVNGSSTSGYYTVGTCASGTMLPTNRTRITCDQLQSCSTASFTLRTLLSGPPQCSSKGITIMNISIPGKVPDAPSNITAVRRGASEVLLRWEAPVDPVPKSIEIYSVEVCESCFGGERGLCCWTRNTSHPSLAVSSTADETFWVHVSAGRQCAGEVAWSKATTKEFAFAPQDVTALRVTDVGDDAFTAAWNRPKERFDYYLVEVTGTRKRSNGVTQSSLASCANGTIIHPDVTQVTCGQFEAHSNVSLTVRTHRNGPPERTSPGVTLGGICIPGAAGPPDVTNLILGTVNTNTFSVTWDRPKGCFDSYVVELYEGESASYPAQRRIGTCKGTTIVPDNFMICRKVNKCKDLSVIVRTRRKGPPLRDSPGATLQDIFNVREGTSHYPIGVASAKCLDFIFMYANDRAACRRGTRERSAG